MRLSALPKPLRFSAASTNTTPLCASRRLINCRPRPTNTTTNQRNHLLRQIRPYSGLPPPRSGIKFWPFFLIIGLGSLGYYQLAQARHEASTAAMSQHSTPNFPNAPRSPSPKPKAEAAAFDPAKVVVLFVLGGPGAGKGTQSARLVSEYGFNHLSAGDLLRAEQDRPGSEFGELIKNCIREGTIVPMEVTIKLLENAMREKMEKTGKQEGKFLIDGFPRKMDQAIHFEKTVCKARFVLFYDCPESELEKRLVERGKTSGRADDNIESIRKRFHTFIDTSMPVVDHYEKEGRVVRVDATKNIDEVFNQTKKALEDRMAKEL